MAHAALLPLAALSACTPLDSSGRIAAPPASVIEVRTQGLSEDLPRISAIDIGQTSQGRPINILRVASEGDSPPDQRPALLVVAGLSGDHSVGVDVALGLAEALAQDHAALLESHTVYVLPGLNLDALVAHGQPDRPTQSFETTFTPDDADRDGRIDEDGPQDLNDDGVISMMRVANPPPGSLFEAEWMLDPDDPRLLVKPDADKGERATHALLIEGLDADGDGQFSEDGVGGVNLDMNFPYRWPEWQSGAGVFQLAEPESKALVNWMLSRDNIIAVLTFGPYDTLVNIPEAGKRDFTGSMITGIEEGDKAEYEAISEAFKEATGMTDAPTADAGGSFRGWAYANFGVFSFSTPVWVRPDLFEAKDPPEEEGGEEGAEEGGEESEGATRPSRSRPDGDESDDAKWLAYSDDERAGAGFADWTAFEHPQLGDVEIGGFVPGFKVNPPEDAISGLVAQQTAFVAQLLGKFPEVGVEGPVAEDLGGDVWRISFRVSNDGFMPTRSASGVRARRIRPMVVHLEVDQDNVIAGSRSTPVETIAGGESRDFEWTVMAGSGTPIVVRVDSPEFGEQSFVVTVGEDG